MANKQIIANKKEAVESLAEEMKKAQSYVVCQYTGLTVLKLEELRHNLREEKCVLKVVKNNIIKRAASLNGFNELDDTTGPSALCLSNKDSVLGPKLLFEFAKKNKQLVLKDGVVDGVYYNDEDMKTIATLPSRITLLAMIAGGLYQPLQQLALGLNMVAESKQ